MKVILFIQVHSSVLLQSSPVCYEAVSAKKLAGLGVNVSAGLLGDDVCVDVAAAGITTPAVPMTAALS